MDWKDRELSQKIIDNRKLVYYCFYKLPQNIITIRNEEDIIQEGFITLWRAIELYDESLDVNFSTYACKIILNKLKQAIKIYGRGHDRNVGIELSKEEENYIVRGSLEESKSFEEVERRGLDSLVEEIRRISRPRWVNIMDKFMQGYTQTELSKEYGMTRQGINNIFLSIKNRSLKKIGEQKINQYLEE